MPAPAQTRVIFQHIDEPGYTNDLACYLRHGGYEVLKKSIARPPADLIRDVATPGGTTQAALNVLQRADGLPGLLTEAVIAAIRRAEELAKS